MSIITVNNLLVHYNNYCVLKDVNFEADEGEFIAIVGKSGSGKTTFLYTLANFIQYQGEIKIPKAIGIVFQQYAVFPWLTVAENISFGLGKYSKNKRQEIIEEHLRLIELENKKDKYPAELSGGQVQRVALARSLAYSPKVLLMDEPYGALDAYTRDKMQQWLLNIWATHKKTIIFVTHNIEEAIFLADRILVLSHYSFIKEIKIPFTRPRSKEIKFNAEFNNLRKKISQSINSG